MNRVSVMLDEAGSTPWGRMFIGLPVTRAKASSLTGLILKPWGGDKRNLHVLPYPGFVSTAQPGRRSEQAMGGEVL